MATTAARNGDAGGPNGQRGGYPEQCPTAIPSTNSILLPPYVYLKGDNTELEDITRNLTMAGTVRALVAPVKGGPLQLQDVLLDNLRPDEALVEVYAVGICHADISCLHGKLPVQYPNVFGHEGSGVVKEVGSGVHDIRPGDAVIMSYNSCGDCPTCRRGAPAYCVHMWALNFAGARADKSYTMRTADGEPLYSNFFGQSSFSSLAIVNHRGLVKVAPGTPFELYAPLGCGMQTGAGAIFNTLDVREGASVAIFGTGSVGMAAIMAAKIRKARIIIGIDINQKRLDISRTLGATHTLDGSATDIVDQIKMICATDGLDGVQYAADCTGIGSMIEQMISSLGILGKGTSIGAPPPGTTVAVNVLQQLTRGRQYIGCNQGDAIPQQMVPFLIEQHAKGTFPVEQIIKTYAVEDFANALEDMRLGTVIKPVLIWKQGSGKAK